MHLHIEQTKRIQLLSKTLGINGQTALEGQQNQKMGKLDSVENCRTEKDTGPMTITVPI